jgi:hypothetical protein
LELVLENERIMWAQKDESLVKNVEALKKNLEESQRRIENLTLNIREKPDSFSRDEFLELKSNFHILEDNLILKDQEVN